MEFDFSDDDTYIDQLSGLSMSETSIDSDYEDYGDAHQV